MTSVKPARVGLLFDYIGEEKEETPGLNRDAMDTLTLVADDFLARGLLDRPVEFVLRHVEGLPRGSFRAVRDAYYELVEEEDCLVVFGPWISENAAPLREYVEELAQVACISMGGTESLLGEWMFALPNGSTEEEPIVMAQVAWYDGCRKVGIAFEDSLLGNEYLRAARAACRRIGLEITGEVGIPQVEADQGAAMRALAAGEPDGILHIGFGLGVVGMNDALKALGWNPRRYSTTAFEFAANSDWWREQFAGWVGLDQYDERNTVGAAFLDQFEARYGRRPAYYFPVYAYDMGRLIMTALSTARPLTGRGVKEALERVKMMPAACGAPGTRLRFGKYTRQGWMGSEFLVARRVLPDASKIVMHGTIEGLVRPWEG
jgi:ABC-type branched-subunit amino acid transport system substrate-binding protein